MSLLILSAAHVADVTSKFDPDELVDLMAHVFHSLFHAPSSSLDLQSPHRTSIQTTHHTALFMPSRISPIGTAIKVVSVPTASAPLIVKEHGLPATTLVLDESTGSVKAVVNASRLTALRNAAAIRRSARTFSYSWRATTLVCIGAGAQIHAHVMQFLSAYPSITTCTIINRSRNSRLATLVSSCEAKHPHVQFKVGLLQDDAFLCDAVRGAHIIVTATSSTYPLFPSNYVSPGTHLCLIGSYKPTMHEVDTALIKRAGNVVVDSKDACLAESGELISAGLGRNDVVELGELVEITRTSLDEHARRFLWTSNSQLVETIRSSGDVTLFKSVGVGIQDVAIASAVVTRASLEGVGTRVEGFET